MKILLMTTKFTHQDGSPWLVSELAEELCRSGHKVTVVNVNWQRVPSQRSKEELPPNLTLITLKAFDLHAGVFGWLVKWSASSILALPFILRQFLTGRRYDLFVGFSPCSALWCALPLATYLSRKSFLVYWDFFPVHNFAIIHSLPSLLQSIAKKIERFLIRQFDFIGLMSPRNMGFFDDYFNIKNCKNKSVEAIILPIWTSVLHVETDAELMRSKLSISSEGIIFIFGGQITHGRSICELCEAALAAHKIDSRIELIICGDGKLAGMVAVYAEKHPTCIKYLGSLPRDEYLKTAASSNIGIVATMPGVHAPAYPSKSLDYMACGIPIMAAVESSTDFGEIVETNGLGLACHAGDVESMKDCMIKLASLRDLSSMGKRGKEFLAMRHSVANVSSIITGACRV